MSFDSQENGNSKCSVVDYDSLDGDIKKLILSGIEVRKLAYCPYSNFSVGACLECDDGSVYTGCNVENATLGLTICAERTAIVKAVSDGKRNFKAISVIAQQDGAFTTPCGQCRQFLAEFSTDTIIYVTRPTLGKVMITTVEELLPFSFKLD